MNKMPIWLALSARLLFAGAPVAPAPRLLLFDHFSNEVGVEWCGGHLEGGEFVPGKVFRGLRLGKGSLHYRTHQSYTARPESPGWLHFNVQRGTLRFWLKPDKAPDAEETQTLFYMSPSGGKADTFHLYAHGRGEVAIAVTDHLGKEWAASASAKLEVGRWSCVEVAWETGVGEKGSLSLRIDGQEVSAARGAITIERMGTELWLGSRVGKETVRGIIDELRIWDRPMAPTPLSDEAKDTVIGFSDEQARKQGLLFYHRFDSAVSCDPDGYAGGRYPVVIKGGGGESRPGVPGKFGRAAQISGPARGSLQFMSEGNFNPQAGTVAMWFKPSQVLLDHWGHLFAEHYRSWDLFVLNRRFRLNTPAGRVNGKFQDIRAGEWLHVAATWDLKNGRFALYVNGKLDNELLGKAADASPQGVFHVGGDEHARQSRRGVYDELRIYNRPLSPEEIRNLAETEIEAPPFDY